MPEVPRETLVERTWSNLATAWRDIAQSAARTVGLSKVPAAAKPESLKLLMRDCLEARGGEVSARMRAAALGRIYLELDAEGRAGFLTVLAQEFAVQPDVVDASVATLQSAKTPAERLKDEAALRQAEVNLSRYRRTFTLSKELDADKVSAELSQGVLRLRIPKAEHAQPRKIAVQVN